MGVYTSTIQFSDPERLQTHYTFDKLSIAKILLPMDEFLFVPELFPSNEPKSMSDLARKDFFVCLGVWLSLEIICFALLPALQLGQTRASLQPWFLASLLLGVGGAILTAGSTQLGDFFQNQTLFLHKKILQNTFVLLVSWLGLLGIGFPLLVISMQLLTKPLELLKS